MYSMQNTLARGSTRFFFFRAGIRVDKLPQLVLCVANSTWLVTSRLDMTRHVRRVERVETNVSSSSCRACLAVLFDKLDTAKCMGSTRRTCRVVSRRDVTSQVEFGYMQAVARAKRACACNTVKTTSDENTGETYRY